MLQHNMNLESAVEAHYHALKIYGEIENQL